jgi:UDP-N-acetylmuramoylalanine--D-glutamate ligase
MLAVSEIRLLGRHNVENYMAAIAAVADWITAEDVLAVARSFTGVPHRFELVAQRGGVRYINGSIDSTPTRTLAALAAMRELRRQEGGGRLPIVILGGRDKNTSFEELGAALCREAKAVVLTGEARDIIRRAIMQSPEYDPDDLSILVIPDWQDAMRSACMMATEGDTVLLSPACTSFDAFKNFEERGEAFRAVVREVTQK